MLRMNGFWDKYQQDAFTQINVALLFWHYTIQVRRQLSRLMPLFMVRGSPNTKADNHQWKPVECASRSLTPTELKYAQIEKEALGIAWACRRFSDYLVGMLSQVETDHKLLVSLKIWKN